MKPEDLYKFADCIVGATSATLAQAIYLNIPSICLDKNVIVSSFFKYFCQYMQMR